MTYSGTSGSTLQEILSDLQQRRAVIALGHRDSNYFSVIVQCGADYVIVETLDIERYKEQWQRVGNTIGIRAGEQIVIPTREIQDIRLL